ncbi:hypothetical protein DPSP01_000282 [Paraphaeosphaeria sporulosa]
MTAAEARFLRRIPDDKQPLLHSEALEEALQHCANEVHALLRVGIVNHRISREWRGSSSSRAKCSSPCIAARARTVEEESVFPSKVVLDVGGSGRPYMMEVCGFTASEICVR